MSDLFIRWKELEMQLAERFGKTPDLNAVLMMIGIQELRNAKTQFSKEEKQDLMHVAVCTLLSQSGYYELMDFDNEGWPHYQQVKELPERSLPEQEDFLKDHILLYFSNQNTQA